MQPINLHNKTFHLLENSEAGTVNTDTVFHYKQQGSIVSATYEGGTVSNGTIIAVLKGTELDMRYQCVTTDAQLKAGKAIAAISFSEANKMILSLQWEWLDDTKEKGTSLYIEQ